MEYLRGLWPEHRYVSANSGEATLVGGFLGDVSPSTDDLLGLILESLRRSYGAGTESVAYSGGFRYSSGVIIFTPEELRAALEKGSARFFDEELPVVRRELLEWADGSVETRIRLNLSVLMQALRELGAGREYSGQQCTFQGDPPSPEGEIPLKPGELAISRSWSMTWKPSTSGMLRSSRTRARPVPSR